MCSEGSDSELITKAFLEDKLGRKVESFTIGAGSEAGDNYMSILYALEVKVYSGDSESGETETLHLLSKCYPKNPTRQAFLNKSNIFWKELFIYQKWIPELKKFQEILGVKEIVKPAFPPFVAGDAFDFEKDKEGNNNQPSDKVPVVYKPFDIYIMMVDLRKTWDYKMVNRLAGIDNDHAVLTINALAEIHALSWIYKQKNNLTKITEKFPSIGYDFSDADDRKMWHVMLDTSMKSTLEVIEAQVGKESPLYHGAAAYNKIFKIANDVFYDQGEMKEHELENLMRVKPKKNSMTEIPWRVVIHGDCWVNNMLFRYNPETKKPEEVILVDLQMCRDACPTTDLAYFIYVSTDAEFRKKNLDNLLQIYTDRFISICELMETEPLPGFSVQELKRRFHRSKLFGFSMSIFCLPMMLKDKENVTDLESLKGDNIEDFFLTIREHNGTNSRYNKRLLEVVQDMYDDGII